MPPNEHEIGYLKQSPISFSLSGPNELLIRHDQLDEELASSADSTVQSPSRKARGLLTRKEKGKKKMPEYGMDRDESERPKSDSDKSDDGPSRVKSTSAKKDSTSANEHLRRSTRQKNPVVRFGYNEYMVNHDAYMTRVAEVREPES